MRKYSQVFLKNKDIAQKITQYFIQIAGKNPVVEIGPGKGVLSCYLYPYYLDLYTAIEIDPAMVEIMKSKFPQIKIINRDFLDIEESQINSGFFCGNLPYHISTAILEKVINFTCFQAAVFMFQKEVAKKIVAEPHDPQYGYLSALIKIRADTEYFLSVSRYNFEPVPEVDSAVVVIRSKTNISPERFEIYRRFISAAFMYKRKTILNSLSISFKTSKDELIWRLENAGINPSSRAEELSPQVLFELSEKFSDLVKNNQ